MKFSLLNIMILLAGLGTADVASAQTQVYVQCPLKRNNADSTQVRTLATGLYLVEYAGSAQRSSVRIVQE